MSQIADVNVLPTDTLTSSSADLTEKRLVRVQAIAGSLFAVFVTLHLSNMLIAPFGIDAFNGYQRFLRQFYQNPLVEMLIVIGPLLTHAVAGVWLFFIRKRKNHKRPLSSRLHTWAGTFLLIFIVGHVLATRGASFFFGVFPEFEGLSFSLWYFPAYFYPYYFLLALAGFYHASNGLRRLASNFGIRVPLAVQFSSTAIIGIWIAISLLSLGGILVEVSDPTDNDFARLGATLFDMDPNKPWR